MPRRLFSQCVTCGRLFPHNVDSRTVTEDFSYSPHHFRRVVGHGDYRVGATHLSVLDREIERLFARSLTELCEKRDVATDESLQGRAKRPRTDRDRTVIPRTRLSERVIR